MLYYIICTNFTSLIFGQGVCWILLLSRNSKATWEINVDESIVICFPTCTLIISLSFFPIFLSLLSLSLHTRTGFYTHSLMSREIKSHTDIRMQAYLEYIHPRKWFVYKCMHSRPFHTVTDMNKRTFKIDRNGRLQTFNSKTKILNFKIKKVKT